MFKWNVFPGINVERNIQLLSISQINEVAFVVKLLDFYLWTNHFHVIDP